MKEEVKHFRKRYVGQDQSNLILEGGLCYEEISFSRTSESLMGKWKIA